MSGCRSSYCQISKSDLGYERLLWIKDQASADFWDDHWERVNIKNLLVSDPSHTLLKVFLQNLMPSSLVLEAGCGLGQWVAILADFGFSIFGVDYAKNTLRKVSNYFSPKYSGRFIAADIKSLPFHNCRFDAIISLGVVEHFWQGPAELIKEMGRVTQPKGLLFISVPYFNPLRRVKAKLGLFQKHSEIEKPTGFYQFAFRIEEMKRILADCGLEVVDSIPYDARKGLKDELSLAKRTRLWLKNTTLPSPDNQKYQDNTGLSKELKKFIKTSLSRIINSLWVNKLAAHMILFVCRNGENLQKK